MKLLVLGQSNCILKDGFIAGLKAALPDADMVNGSVGAGPGAQVARLMATDFSIYDAVIFDSLVNDENLARFVGGHHFYATLMFRILSTIAAQTELVVAGFCNKRHANAPSEHEKLQRETCAKVGGRFVSPREVLADVAAPYADNYHLTVEASIAFAGHVARAVLDTVAAVPRRDKTAVRSYATEFSTIELSSPDFDPLGPVVEQSTNLFHLASRRLVPGQRVDLGRSYRLIGALINAWQTRAQLRLDTDPPRVISMMHKQSKGLQIKYLPFRDGAVCSAVTIQMDEDALVENTPHELSDYDGDQTPSVNLGSLVYWNASDS